MAKCIRGRLQAHAALGLRPCVSLCSPLILAVAYHAGGLSAGLGPCGGDPAHERDSSQSGSSSFASGGAVSLRLRTSSASRR